MRTLVSAIVAGGLILATTAANAAPWHYGPPYPPPAPPPSPYVSVTVGGIAGAITAGAFLGLAIGSILAPRPAAAYPYYPAYPTYPVYPSPPSYYALTPHQAWCANQYGASYDVGSDSVLYTNGVRYLCGAPY